MPFDSAAGTFLVPGPAGASAYEAWRGLGNTGTVADFLETLVGPRGKDSTVPGPEGKQGPAGAGSVAIRTASSIVRPWTAVIADGTSNCVPADPTNPAHRGLVIGISAFGGAAGSPVEIQNAGDLSGPSGGFSAGDVLCVGSNGVLTKSLPDNAVWRQPVATIVSGGHIVVSLGEASEFSDDADAIISEGGFSIPAAVAEIVSGTGPGKYIRAPELAVALLPLLTRLLDSLPLLPTSDADIPAAGGLFRNGDANGYTLIRVYPKA